MMNNSSATLGKTIFEQRYCLVKKSVTLPKNILHIDTWLGIHVTFP